MLRGARKGPDGPAQDLPTMLDRIQIHPLVNLWTKRAISASPAAPGTRLGLTDFTLTSEASKVAVGVMA